MKKLIVFILTVQITSAISAQSSTSAAGKPPVDFNAIESWPSVSNGSISGNGQYVLYYIYKGSFDNKTLFIASTVNNWKKEIAGGNDAVFSEDGKKVFFKTPGDSLCTIALGSDKTEYMPGVASFKLFTGDKSEYLLYRLYHNNELVLRDMVKGITKTYQGVESYQVSKNGHTLLLQSSKDKEGAQTLIWVNLPQGSAREIWKGKGAGNFVFDNEGKQLAFEVEQPVDGTTEQTFRYYNCHDSKAGLLANNRTEGLESGYTLNGIDRFSQDGTKLFFKIKEPDFPKPKPGAVMVDVWSYTDARLQSQQLRALTPDRWGDGGPKSYLCVLNINSRKVIRLQQANETITLFDGRNDEWGFVTRVEGDAEDYWSKTGQPTYFLVSTKTAERKQVAMGNADFSSLGMSPDCKYIILHKNYFDDLYSYNTATGMIHSLSEKIPIPLVDSNYDFTRPVRGIRLAAWTNDNKLMIYDSYDLWLLDPEGRDNPICLTNGYGRKHNFVFRLPGSTDYRDKVVKDYGTLVLSVFNNANKDNGFYSITIGKQANPELLTMGPYEFYHPTVDAGFPMQPIKAKNANVWLVKRESASDFPNLFATSDFKNFKQLSAVYPEKKYNWFSTRLVNYLTTDGKPSQGILYLPDNLDTTKKNPVIIYYYEKLSQHLNDYKAPEFSPGWMEIPYFVSQGYVVFTPDIHYVTGHHAESTCNSVIGAAKYLMKFPWIDSTKMAVQGHSMGGFETNNIITHTNIFAAACTAAGSVDVISHAGGLSLGIGGKGNSDMNFVEKVQYRMGAILWKDPDSYIKNSPIFLIDKIQTPVLIMHNKGDGAVPFEQAIEFFTALRRLGKRAWMLQYDGQDHSLDDKDSKDYTLRMKQFFDHYLKGAPAPKWMVEGIPAKMKGVDDGLELEPPGVEPGAGLPQSYNTNK